MITYSSKAHMDYSLRLTTCRTENTSWQIEKNRNCAISSTLMPQYIKLEISNRKEDGKAQKPCRLNKQCILNKMWVKKSNPKKNVTYFELSKIKNVTYEYVRY